MDPGSNPRPDRVQPTGRQSTTVEIIHVDSKTFADISAYKRPTWVNDPSTCSLPHFTQVGREIRFFGGPQSAQEDMKKTPIGLALLSSNSPPFCLLEL
jgi:hypothetical protein